MKKIIIYNIEEEKDLMAFEGEIQSLYGESLSLLQNHVAIINTTDTTELVSKKLMGFARVDVIPVGDGIPVIHSVEWKEFWLKD